MKRPFMLLSALSILLLSANYTFSQCCNFTYQQQVEPPTSAATFGVALGDFDGDGDLDAVTISAYAGIDVYFNNGSGTFTLSAHYAVGTNDDFYGVHVADVDNDGDLDIIAIPFYTGTNLTVLKNNGSGIFTVSSLATNIATYNAAVGDVDGDGDIDVFLPNAGGGAGKVLKNNGSGVFSVFQSSVTGARGHDAALGDLDGDGDLDAFVTENGTYGNSVFLNDGNGTFTQFGSNFSLQGGTVALGDFDGDGDLDAWVGGSGNTSEIWLNNGSGSFTLGAVITTHPTWGYCKAVNLYDYDNDGDLDVFLGFYSHKPQVWINNGNLTFTLCYEAPVGSSCHGQAIGDMNGDGLIDIYSGLFSNTDGDYVFLNISAAATIQYESGPYCNDITTPQSVTMGGTSGGTFSANPPGLIIDVNSGAITPSGSTPGSYTVTYTVSGCDFTASVEISTVDLTTTLAGATLTANQTGASYQWVDCNNAFAEIGGANTQDFTPASNGNYAVIITYNGCSDTSGCVNVLTVGVDASLATPAVKVYPNPGYGRMSIEIHPDILGSTFSVYDLYGNELISGTAHQPRFNLDISRFSSGLYILHIEGCKPVRLEKL